MRSLGLIAGGVLCALAVAAGAFGAHALHDRLDAASLQIWETAARYLMYTGLGLLGIGASQLQLPRAGFLLAELALLAGGVVFTSSLFALAIGGPRWLGAVTPIGGVGMIAGFLLFAWSALRG
ncbi:MAG: DUF423 domain-containing protein [Acidobacteriota bacterium]